TSAGDAAFHQKAASFRLIRWESGKPVVFPANGKGVKSPGENGTFPWAFHTLSPGQASGLAAEAAGPETARGRLGLPPCL
ncbi:MAG: hypothetical protein IJ181_11325, partial [Acidaminococcaceae bacterium]|nr:hypothetical protein [Acidaminococcaceae bacterium]